MGNRIRPNGHRAKLAIASIWAVISMNLIGLCLSFIIYFVFTQLIANSGSNYYETVSFITSFVSFAYVAALITSIVMFLHWFRRAYYNLNVVTDECVYEDSWAVKAWFIPFLNLYRPYQMMKELFEKNRQPCIREIYADRKRFQYKGFEDKHSEMVVDYQHNIDNNIYIPILFILFYIVFYIRDDRLWLYWNDKSGITYGFGNYVDLHYQKLSKGCRAFKFRYNRIH